MRLHLLLPGLFASDSLLAHHSFDVHYDSSSPITVAGIVTKVEWTNPHAYLYLDVDNEGGGATKLLECTVVIFKSLEILR